MDSCFLEELPQRLVGDKAYDSDLLDARLAEERNVELIAPHRGSRRKPPSQDGRPLRRYCRRGSSNGYLPGFGTSTGWWSAMSII